MGRIIVATLVGVSLLCASACSVFAYYAIAASRAEAAPASSEVAGAFEEAARGWRRHIDLPVHRLVLSEAEEYDSGVYLFVFDVYTWFGVGSGYVTHAPEVHACGGGGLMSDGGFAGIGEIASDSGLRDTRESCTRAYGPARIVAPTVR